LPYNVLPIGAAGEINTMISGILAWVRGLLPKSESQQKALIQKPDTQKLAKPKIFFVDLDFDSSIEFDYIFQTGTFGKPCT